MSRSFATFRSDQFHNRLLVLSGYQVDTVEDILPYQMDQRWEDGADADGSMALFAESPGLRSREQTAYPSEEARSMTRCGGHQLLIVTPLLTRREGCVHVHRVMRKSFEAFSSTANEADYSRRMRAAKPYIHTMKLEASRRRRIFVSSRGYLGLGQETLHVGDIISILLGETALFLIREAELGYHELIGEAYVHGIMHGEFLAKNPTVDQFTIC